MYPKDWYFTLMQISPGRYGTDADLLDGTLAYVVVGNHCCLGNFGAGLSWRSSIWNVAVQSDGPF